MLTDLQMQLVLRNTPAVFIVRVFSGIPLNKNQPESNDPASTQEIFHCLYLTLLR
jgi:hypothetical protein